MVWEIVFMMLVLKLPILYLCAVIWWAIRAEPRPLEGAALPVGDGPEPWQWSRRRRSRGPRRGPARGYTRVGRAALPSASARR